MRWMHRQVQLVSYSCTCFCCFEVWSCPTIHREPTRCSRLAEHARHPGAIAARLGSKQRPRAARAEAARAGRWWRWLDGRHLFVCTSTRIICTIGVPAVDYMRSRVVSKKYEMRVFAMSAHKKLHSYSKLKNEVTNRRVIQRHFSTSKKSCIQNGLTYQVNISSMFFSRGIRVAR